MRDYKWHIWQDEEKVNPLCWDEQLLEFDNEQAALDFLRSVRQVVAETVDEEKYITAHVCGGIVYYDTGYLNATNFVVDYDGDECEMILVAKG
jgi:hypothetical protein